MSEDIYEQLKQRALELISRSNLLGERVVIRARTLSPQEAIGNPEADDFPLQKGKERLMQAEFRGAMGQAFTDRYGDFAGLLGDVLQMTLENNYRRAVFIAALNAVVKHVHPTLTTVHCRDQEPANCAVRLADFIREKYGLVKITQVGFQPRMVESLSRNFFLRLLDLDPDNIGTEKFGVLVEGPETAGEAVNWADLLLVTGTTIVNGTVGQFLGAKPVLFYGTTIAAAAELMGWDRFCAFGK